MRSFACTQLDALDAAKRTIQHIRHTLSDAEQKRLLGCFEPLEAVLLQPDEVCPFDSDRALYFQIRQKIKEQDLPFLKRAISTLQKNQTTEKTALLLEVALILDEEEIIAEFESMPIDEKSPLYVALIALAAKKNGLEYAKKIASKQLLEPFPRTHLLGAAFLAGHIDMNKGSWKEGAFFFEQKCLESQVDLILTSAKSTKKMRV